MSEESLGKDLKALEAALGSLTPRASRVDRDRLMFLAGQAAGRGQGSGVRGQGSGVREGEAPAEPASRGQGSGVGGQAMSSWLWPAATAAMLLVSGMLGGLVWWRPAPEAIERIVYVRVEPPAPMPPTLVKSTPPETTIPRIANALGPLVLGGSIQADYLRLRNQVLVSGLDALPEPRHADGSAKTPQSSDYRQLLNSALRSKRET